MAIKFHCASCEADFEFEIPRLIERPTALKCPHCNTKPQAHRAEALATALEDLLSSMSALRTKYQFALALDTEKLPPPYGPAAGDEGLGALVEDDLDVGDDEDLDDEDEDADTDAEDEDEDSDDDEDDDDEEGEEDEAEEGSDGDEDDFEDDDAEDSDDEDDD